MWASHGRPWVVFGFTIAGGRIAEIELIAEPARIDALDVVVLGG